MSENAQAQHKNQLEALEVRLKAATNISTATLNLQEALRQSRINEASAREMRRAATYLTQYWEGQSNLLLAKVTLMHQVQRIPLETNQIACQNAEQGCKVRTSNEANAEKHNAECAFAKKTAEAQASYLSPVPHASYLSQTLLSEMVEQVEPIVLAVAEKQELQQALPPSEEKRATKRRRRNDPSRCFLNGSYWN